MALTEWGLMAHLPSDHCSLVGTFSEVDPLQMSKINKFTLVFTNPFKTNIFKLNATHVC